MPDDEFLSNQPENPLPDDETLAFCEPSGTEAAVRRFPERIGRYRVIRLLGEGGMGAVYEVEQDQPRRHVALKVIRAAWASPEMLRRFELESQTLGRLHHPGIAQIYEAGSADTGFDIQPFFAMELIHGKPLIGYASAERLTTRQRLTLMIQVCEAVQHAHQHGIIHRDLKPGNILVDETAQPKILDFGLARVTDSDTEATRQTDMGQLLGTLAYMSPEQVTGDPIAIDTRSDVYALGVILYELLAGKSPYTLTRHLHEVVRTIQQVDPAPLGSVNRVYRGDIETIVAKALEKDKDRRYASAVELAADMRRYLEDQPITAKPASAGYQLQKFARRHKVLVASAATVFVVLAVGAMVSTWQAVLARRAEKRAHQQSEIARAVNDFLRHDLLAQASAYNQAKPDPDLKVRTALDRAAAQVEGRFEKQPLVEASIHNTIGSAYIDLGLYAEAQRQFERELALRRREMGEDHPDTLPAMGSLATVYERTGELKKAEPLYVKDLELQERTLGKDNPNTLKAMNGLAVTYMEEGRYAESAAIFGALVPREQRVFGEGDLQTLRAMGNLAALYDVEGKLAESETLLVSTLEKKRRFLGEYNPETLDSMSNLGDVYEKEGEYAKAEPLLVNAVAGYRRVLGESHSSTINAMTTLADLYRISGKTAQAETLATQTLVTARRSLGEAHHFTLDSMFVLAQVDLREGKEAQEEGLLNKVLEARRRTLGPEHPDTLAALVVLSEIRLRQRRFSEAGTFVREALEAYRKSMPDSWQGHMCQSLLGASLAGQKKLSEAEPLLISGYAGMLQQKSSIDASNHARLSQAGDRIVRFYKESGREDKAAEWKNKLPTN